MTNIALKKIAYLSENYSLAVAHTVAYCHNKDLAELLYSCNTPKSYWLSKIASMPLMSTDNQEIHFVFDLINAVLSIHNQYQREIVWALYFNLSGNKPSSFGYSRSNFCRLRTLGVNRLLARIIGTDIERFMTPEYPKFDTENNTASH